MNIIPINEAGKHRTGTLNNITKAEIIEILGFKPNIKDDPSKVVNSWGFSINGNKFGIWDYKGSHKIKTWSCYGDHDTFKTLFGDKYS